MRFALGLAAMIVLAACSGTIPSNYTAGNIVRTEGAAKVGTFVYQAHAEGKAAPNQLVNSAVGTVYISENVVDLVRQATALELEKSGVKLDEGSRMTVSGDVLDFRIDDLGYSVDWYYTIRYRILDGGSVVHQRDYTLPKKTTGKFGQAGDYTQSINVMIRGGYEMFARDPDVQSILRKG